MRDKPITIPPPLMTSEPGSYARRTVVERMPQIIDQVIADNQYAPHVVAALEELKVEICSKVIQALTEPAADVAQWNRELTAHPGKTWRDVPWYFAETYFHRRLLEAVEYFQPGPYRAHDPFGKQKQQQEDAAVKGLTERWGQLSDADPERGFDALLHACLWGNRADLSRFTATSLADGPLMTGKEDRYILIDHTDQVRELLSQGVQRVDFVSDNVGFDMLFDLVLADFLLARGWVRGVVFHVKGHPFFVSDAMVRDVQATVSLLCGESNPAMQELGARLSGYLEAGRLILKEDPFWTSSSLFRHLPPSLRATLSNSELVILKGDVNYRRLLDDAHWPHTTRMEEAAAYFPTSFVTLRTLKGEIIVGLQPGQAEALYAEDPTWLINGKRGVIQFLDPN